VGESGICGISSRERRGDGCCAKAGGGNGGAIADVVVGVFMKVVVEGVVKRWGHERFVCLLGMRITVLAPHLAMYQGGIVGTCRMDWFLTIANSRTSIPSILLLVPFIT